LNVYGADGGWSLCDYFSASS